MFLAIPLIDWAFPNTKEKKCIAERQVMFPSIRNSFLELVISWASFQAVALACSQALMHN